MTGDAIVDTITPWIHIVAVTVWIGPQFLLFIAAIPAVRSIEDRAVRARVMRTIVTRFGWIAWVAMGVIVLSGTSNLFQVQDDSPTRDISDPDFRYFHIFTLKMVLLGLALVLTAAHTFFVGPRQLDLTEQMDADPAQVARLRRVSISISAAALLVSIGIVLVAVLLADHDYSFGAV